jgi:hypothetical protein
MADNVGESSLTADSVGGGSETSSDDLTDASLMANDGGETDAGDAGEANDDVAGSFTNVDAGTDQWGVGDSGFGDPGGFDEASWSDPGFSE